MDGKIESFSYKWQGETRERHILRAPVLFENYPIVIEGINSNQQQIKSIVMTKYFGIRCDERGDYYVFINKRDDGNVRAFLKNVNNNLRIDFSLGVQALNLGSSRWLRGRELEFARERMEFHSKNNLK